MWEFRKITAIEEPVFNNVLRLPIPQMGFAP